MGHELDSDVTPMETGLDGFIRKSGGFVGYESLQALSPEQVSKSQIVSLLFHDKSAIPLGHEPVSVNNNIVGKTTSCAYGYRVDKPIALAQVNTRLDEGEAVNIDIAGISFLATVSHLALFDSAGSRMKT